MGFETQKYLNLMNLFRQLMQNIQNYGMNILKLENVTLKMKKVNNKVE